MKSQKGITLAIAEARVAVSCGSKHGFEMFLGRKMWGFDLYDGKEKKGSG